MARQDWAGAVSNLWVIAEQLTAYLWSRDVIDESKADSDSIVGRRPQLEDSRTWTAANRQELYQKGSFGTETLRALYVTRKSRNDLVQKSNGASLCLAHHSVKGTGHYSFRAEIRGWPTLRLLPILRLLTLRLLKSGVTGTVETTPPGIIGCRVYASGAARAQLRWIPCRISPTSFDRRVDG